MARKTTNADDEEIITVPYNLEDDEDLEEEEEEEADPWNEAEGDDEEDETDFADEDLGQFDNTPPQDFKEYVGQAQGMDALYDAHKKTIFLLDESGSMEQIVNTLAMYSWNDDLDAMRKNINQARSKIRKPGVEIAWNQAEEDVLAEIMDKIHGGKRRPFTENELLAAIQITNDDPQFRVNIAGSRWCMSYAVYKTSNPRARSQAKAHTRTDIMRAATINEIEKRRAKYPESEILAYAFAYSVRQITGDLIAGIKKIRAPGHMTNLFKALTEVVAACKKNPSAVGLHHAVVVTDGEATDHDPQMLPKLTDEAVSIGLVCDVIRIGRSTYEVDAVKALKAFCAATNGTYTEIDSIEEFETKMVEAASRKLLPPAPAAK